MRPLALFLALGLSAVGAARADDPEANPLGADVSVLNGTLVVNTVDEDGPGAKAGLKEGDVIVRINDLVVKEKGLRAKDIEAIGNEIVRHKPGDKIRLTVKRGGKEHRLELTVPK